MSAIAYRAGLIWITLLLVVDQVSATDLQPGIFGEDDRRAVEERSGAWSAIGQVNVAGYRYAQRCTGTLVAENVVITAAHCVMDPRRRKPFPLHQIHFLAGVRRSSWMAHSTAKCLQFPADYEYVAPTRSRVSPKVPQGSLRTDIVFIVLENALTEIAPLKIDHADSRIANLSLVHASYAADRRYRLTAHFGCHLSGEHQGLWFTDCDTHRASSGGPLLVETERGAKVAAIMVGIATKAASIALPLDGLEVERARECSSSSTASE
jgi:protease YdgD